MPRKSDSLRFVVLYHTGFGEPHFDLMFETESGSTLTTWRSVAWPIDRPTRLIRLGAHRRDYLAYEGDVSGGRGQVRRVAQGACSIQRWSQDEFWSIQFQDEGLAPVSLKHVSDDDWLAMPVCGG